MHHGTLETSRQKLLFSYPEIVDAALYFHDHRREIRDAAYEFLNGYTQLGIMAFKRLYETDIRLLDPEKGDPEMMHYMHIAIIEGNVPIDEERIYPNKFLTALNENKPYERR